MKTAAYISDPAWQRLKTWAYELHYVRVPVHDGRPRGISAFLRALAWYEFEDTRPEEIQGTGQWCTGYGPYTQRALDFTPACVVQYGRLALQFGIYPYRTQRPVIDGYRREATPPVLYPLGVGPPGSPSLNALIGPVLEAVGLGYLSPLGRPAEAPPGLYLGPSTAMQMRRKRRLRVVDDAIV